MAIRGLPITGVCVTWVVGILSCLSSQLLLLILTLDVVLLVNLGLLTRSKLWTLRKRIQSAALLPDDDFIVLTDWSSPESFCCDVIFRDCETSWLEFNNPEDLTLTVRSTDLALNTDSALWFSILLLLRVLTVVSPVLTSGVVEAFSSLLWFSILRRVRVLVGVPVDGTIWVISGVIDVLISSFSFSLVINLRLLRSGGLISDPDFSAVFWVWLLSWLVADWLSAVIVDIDGFTMGCSSPLTSLIGELDVL